MRRRAGMLSALLLCALLLAGPGSAQGRKLLQSSTAAAFCAGKAPGMYADVAGGCAGYFSCSSGSNIYQACGSGTLFDSATKTCSWQVASLHAASLWFAARSIRGLGGVSGFPSHWASFKHAPFQTAYRPEFPRNALPIPT